MYATDFIYDEKYLSDFGFIVCDFNGTNGAVFSSAGSKISFEKITRNKGVRYTISDVKYDECVTCTFDIAKNPDIFDANEREITSDECRDLMRWLNRKDYHKFHPILEKYDERYYCNYNATFNIETIKIAERLYGLRLTMESDAPYGYGKQITESIDFSCDSIKHITNKSDEIGYMYPDVKITYKGDPLSDDGIFTLQAKLFSDDYYFCNMEIKGCTADEVITIHGNAQIIETSESDHKISNDFNFDFFKLSNTYKDRINIIRCNKPCKVEISYYPIIKTIL